MLRIEKLGLRTATPPESAATKPRTNSVFPAPRSPSRTRQSPLRAFTAREAPSARVASTDIGHDFHWNIRADAARSPSSHACTAAGPSGTRTVPAAV